MSPRVLVVEGDPSVRGLLQTLLSAEGYDVATSADGLAGLREAVDTPPALVLLDLVMPDLGGLQVLEQLRADPELSGTAVVGLTGKVEVAPDLRELLGGESVFVKPFPVAELLSRVAVLTGGPTAGAA